MPYCVNCGVELNNGAKRCPLCNTEVILSETLVEHVTSNSLPQQRHVVESAFDKKLWIQVVSVLMVIPALTSIVVNAAFGEGLTWSLYVVASLGAVWVWCVSPFLYRRNIVPLWIAIDELAMLGLLYLVDAMSPSSGWFAPLALPITVCLAVLVLSMVALARKGVLRELRAVAATLIAVCILCLVIEGAVDLYRTGTIMLQWSLLVLASCVPLSVIAIMLQRRQSFIEGMRFWFRI